jgi:hypothetical protein
MHQLSIVLVEIKKKMVVDANCKGQQFTRLQFATTKFSFILRNFKTRAKKKTAK